MLIPLYPAGHKKENTRKADKDWTEAEREDYEHAVEWDRQCKTSKAQQILAPIEEAKATLGKG